jgi:hypothetical protein
VKPGSPPLSPGHSGHLRWSSPPMLGAKLSPQLPLPTPPVGICENYSLGRSGWFSPRYPPPSNTFDKVPHRAFSSKLAEPPLVLVMREYSSVEASWCGAPGACSVKSSSGSLWLAAQALPCHAIQTSTWATVSVIPPL